MPWCYIYLRCLPRSWSTLSKCFLYFSAVFACPLWQQYQITASSLLMLVYSVDFSLDVLLGNGFYQCDGSALLSAGRLHCFVKISTNPDLQSFSKKPFSGLSDFSWNLLQTPTPIQWYQTVVFDDEPNHCQPLYTYHALSSLLDIEVYEVLCSMYLFSSL